MRSKKNSQVQKFCPGAACRAKTDGTRHDVMPFKRDKEMVTRHVNILILLLFMISGAAGLAAPGGSFSEPVYELTKGEESLSMTFSQSWSFDQIELPAVSQELWGEANQCRAAIIKVAGRGFVSRLSENGNRLIFNLAGAISDAAEIIPVLKVSTGLPAGEKPGFTATPARTFMQVSCTRISSRLSSSP